MDYAFSGIIERAVSKLDESNEGHIGEAVSGAGLGRYYSWTGYVIEGMT
jgi:hypothetical protein